MATATLRKENVHIIARSIAGILLIVSAEFKAYQLTVGSAEVSLLMESRLITTSAVIMEFILGPCLLLGVFPAIVWRVAVAVFFTFSAITAYLWIRGAPSCGCLGGLTIHPQQMFLVDLLVLIALVSSPPSRQASRSNLVA